MTDTTLTLIGLSLELAVPLWTEKLSRMPWDRVIERARECSDIVAEKGDVLQFKSKKKGESARAFNALAEGLAALSFCPGGVTFLGVTWAATHPESGSAEALAKVAEGFSKLGG